MTIRDTINERLARADGATEGPWHRHDFGHSGEQEPSSIVVHTGKFDWQAIYDGESVVASMGWDAPQDSDAEFIAAARTEHPQAYRALLGVLDLHAADKYGDCAECYRIAGRGNQPHPCATVQAIEAAMVDT